MDKFTLYMLIFVGIPILLYIVGFIVLLIYADSFYRGAKELLDKADKQFIKFLKSPEKYRKP